MSGTTGASKAAGAPGAVDADHSGAADQSRASGADEGARWADDSGWADIRHELSAVDASDAEVATLISHLSHRLTGHFGNDRIEVWRAKEGLHKHPVDEVAALIVAKLAPLLNELAPGTIERLRSDAKLDTPVVFPWTDRWDPPGSSDPASP